MKEAYMDRVLARSRELSVLEMAADRMPEAFFIKKWLIAFTFGMAGILYPAVSAAMACLV